MTLKYGQRPKAPAGVFQFKRPKAGRADDALAQTEGPEPGQDWLAGPNIGPGPYTVKGRRASDLEYLLYLSLRRNGWRDGDIQFQVDFLGGRLPGGVVLDFVVWAYGGPVILEPNGDYWHLGAQQLIDRDRQRSALIAAAWNKPFQYHILPQADFVDFATTDRKVAEYVGRG